MSQPSVITFNAASATVIAPLQNVLANHQLLLNNTDINGNPISANYVVSGSQMAVIPNFQRPLTITSANDLTGVNFVIVGASVNSTPVTETLAGPNNGSVTSVSSYNKIISITANANANGVSIGVFTTGLSRWIKLDANRDNPALAVIQAVVNTANNAAITYTVNGTASRVENNFTGIPVTPAVFSNPISAGFTNANTSVVGNEVLNYQAVNVSVTASANGGSMVLTVLQSGV